MKYKSSGNPDWKKTRATFQIYPWQLKRMDEIAKKHYRGKRNMVFQEAINTLFFIFSKEKSNE